MSNAILGTVQSINLSDIPKEFHDEIWPKLDVNGGNVIYIERDSAFGKWLETQGFKFDMPRLKKHKKTWAWMVIFR
jgi:hypothetical protein